MANRKLIKRHMWQMSKIYALIPLAVMFILLTATANPDVIINEFVSSNGSTLADEDGDYSDWIELYNSSAEPVALDGWYLSDDEDDPLMWAFPNVLLEPGGYLVVFASGKNRTDGIHFHTNFSISSMGEPLLLSNSVGELIDFVEPISLPRNVSYGRQPDGGSEWYFYTEPTPNSPNDTAFFDAQLPPPGFSVVGGFYEEEFTLTLIESAENARIYYTLDGSDPDPSNLDGTTYQYKNVYPGRPGDPFGELLERSYRTIRYNGEAIPILNRTSEPNGISNIATTTQPNPRTYFSGQPIFKGTVVRAIAIRDGALPSDVVTHTYLIDAAGRNRYSLPVVSIAVQEDYLFDYEYGMYVAGKIFDDWRAANPDLDGILTGRPANYNQRGRAWEAPASIEYFPTESQNAVFSQNIGIRVHGAGSRQLPVKSLRLYARRDYDERSTFDYPFFDGLTGNGNGKPIQSFNRLLLRNSGNDYWHSYFRDGFVQKLVAPTGLDQVAFKQHIVFVNGEYWGILNLRERLDQSHLSAHHSIDPDDIALMENNAVVRIGTETDRNDFRALRHFVDLEDMSDSDAFNMAAEFMDMDNFILYNAVQIYIANLDWPGNNVDYWRKIITEDSMGSLPSHDGRWRWILYDLDSSFGFWFGSRNPVSTNSLRKATEEDGPSWPNPEWGTRLLRNLLENDSFRHQFINTIADLSNSIFVPERAIALIDELEGNISPYLAEFRHRYIGSVQYGGNYLKNFAIQRPTYVQQHVVEHFNLSGTSVVDLDNDNPAYGKIRINSLVINEDLPGLETAESLYPWTGVYYQGVPIQVEALPNPGYRFAGWGGDIVEAQNQLLELTLTQDLFLTAHFEQAPLPIVLQAPEFISMQANAGPMTIDLNSIFEVPFGAPPEFDIHLSSSIALDAKLQESFLILTPQKQGGAKIILSATNGNNPPVTVPINLIVYPIPHRLSLGPYSFVEWDSDNPDHSFPANMLFLQSDKNDPGLDEPLRFAYHVPHDDYNENDLSTIGFPYNNSRRTRINGLGTEGISFINTGRGRDLGGALLSLDTRGVHEAIVTWRGTTRIPNNRTYAIRLLYRLGNEGEFRTLLMDDGSAMEYLVNDEPMDSFMFTATSLPPDILGQPNVQLLWRYYWISGESGPRPELGLGEIQVEPIFTPITPDEEENFRQYIRHFYLTLLDREPEPGALDAWINGYDRMVEMNLDVRFLFRDISRVFIFSEEYENRQRNDEEFIRDCYAAFMERVPSQGEIDAWIPGNWTRPPVLTNFTESAEFEDRVVAFFPGREGIAVNNFASTMYFGALNRFIDPAGLDYWSGEFLNAPDVRQRAREMFFHLTESAEYLDNEPTAGDYVTSLYRSFMGRFPAQNEIDFWSGEIVNEHQSLDEVVEFFSNSGEFTDRLILYGLVSGK